MPRPSRHHGAGVTVSLGRRRGQSYWLQVTLVRPPEMESPHMERGQGAEPGAGVWSQWGGGGDREQRPGAGVWSRGRGAVGSFAAENVLVAGGGLLQHMNRYLGLGGLGGPAQSVSGSLSMRAGHANALLSLSMATNQSPRPGAPKIDDCLSPRGTGPGFTLGIKPAS